MPLIKATYKAQLKASLITALTDIMTGMSENDNPSVVIGKVADEFATAISDATDTYITSATITIPIGSVSVGVSPSVLANIVPIPVSLS